MLCGRGIGLRGRAAPTFSLPLCISHYLSPCLSYFSFLVPSSLQARSGALGGHKSDFSWNVFLRQDFSLFNGDFHPYPLGGVSIHPSGAEMNADAEMNTDAS